MGLGSSYTCSENARRCGIEDGTGRNACWGSNVTCQVPPVLEDHSHTMFCYTAPRLGTSSQLAERSYADFPGWITLRPSIPSHVWALASTRSAIPATQCFGHCFALAKERILTVCAAWSQKTNWWLLVFSSSKLGQTEGQTHTEPVTHFVLMDIPVWEDKPTVFCSVMFF